MGEIADGLINGGFDFYTGEYLGKGCGFPRTANKSLDWEKPSLKNDFKTPEKCRHGVFNYIIKNSPQRHNMKSPRLKIKDYNDFNGWGFTQIEDMCVEIQKDFGHFVKWFKTQKGTSIYDPNITVLPRKTDD